MRDAPPLTMGDFVHMDPSTTNAQTGQESAAPEATSEQPSPDPATQGEPTDSAEGALRDAGRRALVAERAAAAEARKALKDATARVTELEAETTALRRSLLAHEVAAEKNLPAALVGRLQGDDREALEADADQLLALLVPPSPEKPARSVPEDPFQGGAGVSGDVSPFEAFLANL